MNSKQAKCIELLGLKTPFTQKELKTAYFKMAGEVHPDKHPGKGEEDWDKKMAEVNDAYETLQHMFIPNKQAKTGHADKSSVFTTECCHKLGLSLETAKAIYEKCRRFGYKLKFDYWLNKRLSDLKKYEIHQAAVLKACNESVMLKDVTFQHIVNLYECDCEFSGREIEFSEWFSNLINIFKEMETKLVEDNYLSINMEIKDYILDSSKRDFITILKEKQEIREMCQELGRKLYEVEHQYYFGDNSGTFKEYLKNELAVFRVVKEIGMTKQEADDYYTLYLTLGHNETKLDFLKEVQAILPFGAILEKGYFTLRKQYDSIPETERPNSFIFWAELKATTHLLQKNSEQILESILVNSKEAGYARGLKDLLMSLGGKHLPVVTGDDKTSKEVEQTEEVSYARKV